MRTRRLRPTFDSLDRRLTLDASTASTVLGGVGTAGTILVAMGDVPPPGCYPGDGVDTSTLLDDNSSVIPVDDSTDS